LAAASLALTAPGASALRRSDLPSITVGDSDGDGLPEISVAGTAGGPCACRCPVVIGGAAAGAAGQEVDATGATVLVVCGNRVAAVLDPDPPEPTRAPHVEVRTGIEQGGLGRGGLGG
jgi:hypothetical protein